MSDVLLEQEIIISESITYTHLWIKDINISSPVDVFGTTDNVPIMVTITAIPFNKETGEIAPNEYLKNYSFGNIRNLINDQDQDTLMAFGSILNFINNKINKELWKQ
jgi:hypothetical protein